MITEYSPSGRAVGRVEELENLVEVLREHEGEYDAIALSSRIQVPRHYHLCLFAALLSRDFFDSLLLFADFILL